MLKNNRDIEYIPIYTHHGFSSVLSMVDLLITILSISSFILFLVSVAPSISQIFMLLIFLLSLLILSIAAFIYRYYKGSRSSLAIKRFMELVRLREGDLGSIYQAEIYRFELKGYYISTRRGTHYVAEFKKDPVGFIAGGIDLKSMSRGNVAAVKGNGVGYVYGELVLVKSSEFGEVVLIPLASTQLDREIRDYILADWEAIYLELRVEACSMYVRINVLQKTRARSCRAEIIASPADDREWRDYKISEIVLREKSDERIDIGSCRDIVIVTSNTVTPKDIWDTLYKEKAGWNNLIAGSSERIKYRAKIVIDIPYTRDRVFEYSLN
jgi:hypothetical protein